MTIIIGVIGAGSECPNKPLPPKVLDLAERVGYLIASSGAVVASGAGSGVMEYVSKGAKVANGITLGILPGLDKRKANPYIDILLPTGIDLIRNFLTVRTSDALIMINGGIGTLNELTIATMERQTSVVVLEESGGWADRVRSITYDGRYLDERRNVSVYFATSPEEAVGQALELGQKKYPFIEGNKFPSNHIDVLKNQPRRDQKIQIGIIGMDDHGPEEIIPPKVYETAESIGRLIAEQGATLISGGRSGIMEATSKGAYLAGGMVVGILPGYSKLEANPYVTIPITTGLGEIRNHLTIRASDAIIMISGSTGTLNEATIAFGHKPLIVLEGSGGWSDRLRNMLYHNKSFDQRGTAEVFFVNSPKEAVRMALESARNSFSE